MYNDDASGATTELENTLLARNGVNCAGTIGEPVSPGNNLDTGITCAFAGIGDQTNVGGANVGLGMLAANGGPSQGSSTFSAPMMTLTLTPTSPAGDAAGATCPSFATDERGVSRPQDGNKDGIAACDIGAFELTQQCPTSFEGFGNVTLGAAGNFAVLERPKTGSMATWGSDRRPPGRWTLYQSPMDRIAGLSQDGPLA